MRKPRILFLTAAASISLAAAALSWAEYTWIPAGVPGLVKIDLGLELRECTSPVTTLADCPSVSIASITVHEALPGHYLITGMPDAPAGSGIGYSLLGSFSGTPFSYTWPRSTITPQSTSAVVSYRIPATITLASGDTLPAVEVSVAGLTSDPTGATVTFNLWSVSTGTLILDDVAATIPDIDAQSDGTWTASLRHSWSSVETSTLSGDYYGRFVISFAAGGSMTIPPAPNSLRVKVFP